MNAIIDRLWAEIEPFAFITRAQFVRGLEDWNVEPVEIDGELAFAVLTRGPEIHFNSFGTGNRITMAMIRDRVGPLLDKHGYVTTRTPKGSPRQHRFNKSFGFRVVDEDENFVEYRLDRCYVPNTPTENATAAGFRQSGPAVSLGVAPCPS